jgi:two-component system sensor histidine kinase VicK
LKDLLYNSNKHLQETVAEKTKEIRNSLEIEKRAHEELAALDRNKNDFIIITQHHLRTPLAQIRWSISSILSGLYGEISPDVERALNSINKSSEKLTKVINNFLDISQLKIGVQLLNKSPTNIKYLFESVLEEYSKEIKQKKLSVSLDQDDSHWPLIEIDLDRMREVISILVDNAIRYNIEGGRITFGTKTYDDQLELTISNTGIELSDTERKKILNQSFFRTKKAKELNPNGMGLGLIVAKTIVEAHNGHINLLSNDVDKSTLITINMYL